MKPTVEFKNVTKRYKMYQNSSEQMKGALVPKRYGEDFYALQDITFTAEAGETIGVVGINGAGKSTLSNIIANITPPTSGKAKINGTVSIIAISSGLDGELTGRENIEYKCLMLGFKKKEIKQLMPEIIAFSDIGNFIDQPVKNYSSGMKSRLGFAISVNIDPDILIVDEALSVGDQTFKQKCYNKMNDFKERGKTIFFVSHSLNQIRQYCNKVIWLEAGFLKAYGPRRKVLPKYRAFLKKYRGMSEEEKMAFREEVNDKRSRRYIPEQTNPDESSTTPVEKGVVPAGVSDTVASVEASATPSKKKKKSKKHNKSKSSRTRRYRKRRFFTMGKLIAFLSIIFVILGTITLFTAKPWDTWLNEDTGNGLNEMEESPNDDSINHTDLNLPDEEEEDTEEDQPDVRYLNVPIANVRTEPDMDSEAVTYAYLGEPYVIQDTVEDDADDIVWLEVEGLTNDVEGWISENVVETLTESEDDIDIIDAILGVIGSQPDLEDLSDALDDDEFSDDWFGDEDGLDIPFYITTMNDTLIDSIGEPTMESADALFYHGEKLDYTFDIENDVVQALHITEVGTPE